MSVLSVDKKNRIVLDKKIREKSGFKKGTKIVAIPFKGGVTLVDVSNKRFIDSLKGFGFDESKHEASAFLFGQKKENQK
jgi:bifunctional DNA-binding transcriptional regulator/antitoxin component of YhaV-PrlF toxin-antitoxin module